MKNVVDLGHRVESVAMQEDEWRHNDGYLIIKKQEKIECV